MLSDWQGKGKTNRSTMLSGQILKGRAEGSAMQTGKQGEPKADNGDASLSRQGKVKTGQPAMTDFLQCKSKVKKSTTLTGHQGK